MNKYSIYIVLLVLISGLTACHDSVTDLKPQSELTEANFYQTADDMERAVLGVYNAYQQQYPRHWVLFETPTDHVHKSEYDFIGGLLQLDQLAFHPGNDIFENFWQEKYNGIFRANKVIQSLDIPDDLPAADRQRIEGEARFLRALFYFDMVRAFGGVPEITSQVNISDARSTPRASEEAIYNLIVDDLEAALSNLPAKGEIESGRATTGAAAALLGQVHVSQGNYETALTYLNQVENMDYRLLDNFDDIYSLENEDHDEGIFTLKYIQDQNGNELPSDFIPYFGVIGYASLGNQIVDVDWDLHQKFQEEDSRTEATITEMWRNPDSEDSEPTYRPYISKFLVPHNGRTSSGLDLHVIRYAEVLLLKAEALYYTGDTQGAVDYINMVRERAFGNSAHNYTLADATSEEEFLDILLLERQLELALENERWPDLVRTGQLDKLEVIEQTQNLTVELDVQPHLARFPIPQHEINETEEGVLEQNEGYN
ncbi:Starch-binding associating with outer membrane [Fodinibius roseus]|uniref:Starch-binding associating with outer membrane n=1 Tax=Fodinibius roseus TaxID=1194090 RepID=A0A1M5L6A2_9BACT|nr:RagB/SusD family nutrient uptake outer membrane protein [Fodinibius roseus]SHG60624.1 Starch-binding associating with outer membrane [Fodinibius roseus]